MLQKETVYGEFLQTGKKVEQIVSSLNKDDNLVKKSKCQMIKKKLLRW